MKKWLGCFLFSVFFLLPSWVFAQNSDQSSSDSGVLVSPPIQEQEADQNSTVNNVAGNVSNTSSQSATGKSSGIVVTPNALSTDDIVVKAAKAVIFQMTVNLKLTQDQISAIQPIIADNIAQVRNLEQSLKNGDIDSSTMHGLREQLMQDENQALSSILTSNQMKGWINIQNQSSSHSKQSNSK